MPHKRAYRYDVLSRATGQWLYSTSHPAMAEAAGLWPRFVVFDRMTGTIDYA